MQTHNALTLPDVRQGVGDWLSGSRDIKEDEAARDRALAQLKHKLQEELRQIRGAVDAVKLQVGGCRKRKNYAGSENYSPH